MIDSIGIVILAAGKGTRLKTEQPKALAQALGRPLLDYVISACLDFAEKSSLTAEVGVVVGHRKELLESWLAKHPAGTALKTAWQKEQKGTADALKACFNDLPHFWDHTYTLVANADTPLISKEELAALYQQLKAAPDLMGVAATFEAPNPTGYGRIVRAGKGFHIVEEKDADGMEKEIKEVNSGCYFLRTAHIQAVLSSISNQNKSGEFYLTDLFQDHFRVEAVKFRSEEPFLGVNTMEQLAQISDMLRERKIRQLMLEGVQFLDPRSTYIDDMVKIERGTIIYPGVTILGFSSIGSDVVIESGSFIKSSSVERGSGILANSYLEEAQVGEQVQIGPMARLRPGSQIGNESKIGNFVEIKKARLERGVKISHLSYVGDAEIGENTNIGCGFITCNYDGVNKHRTKIGKNAFIGSDCQAIAPIEIGDHSFVAAGTTITKSVPAEAFAIGRPVFSLKEGAAKRFLKVKKKD
jgi:bifunctional UDP-N-acetylglucosamine pyrophosphorylase / glucosamine-1-phosphate N-acetyltransferase